MNWFIIVPVIIVTLLFVLFITTITIKLMACYTEEGQHFFIQVRILFIRYTFDVLAFVEKQQKKDNKEPESVTKDEEPKEKHFSLIEKISQLIKSMTDIHTISKGFLRKVKVKQFLWRSHIGTGDAANTGIITGFVWQVKGLILGILSNYTNVIAFPKLEVIPVYDGIVTTSELECMVSFRIGQMLFFAFSLFRHIHKHRSIFYQTEVRG